MENLLPLWKESAEESSPTRIFPDLIAFSHSPRVVGKPVAIFGGTLSDELLLQARF